MEAYTWVIILAAWSLLLLLGLAGGDPLAAGQPGREAPAIALTRWLHRRTTRRPAVRAQPRAERTRESGLHATA